jgi:ssDNA-binding Zn-finger/Zn-ribbon topoisomerase 1
MTSPPREIEVECPSCGCQFEGWYRPSINLNLGEEWTEEEIERATSVECPECHQRTRVSSLIVGKDGIFRVLE